MARLFKKLDGIECRACGSAFAPPDKKGPFCGSCMSKFIYQYGKKYSEVDINKWLAQQVIHHLNRIKTHGFAERCNALTRSDQNGNAGYQCPNYACAVHKGRRLCNRHMMRKKALTFVDEVRDPYEFITGLVSQVSVIDPDFKNAIREAVI